MSAFGSVHPHSTGSPLLDAQTEFFRARRAYVVARLGRGLRRPGVGDAPRALACSAALGTGTTRLEVVRLEAIVGTAEPTRDFDSMFRPASDALRRRWERIAVANRTGHALPPVVLRRQPDGYYVVDGRHRVSVARALRQRDIAAWVTGPR